ncbi:hypothetical protein HW555_010886 [Spodoptera exigua]|uniref:Uncharacterized protein n=1 Tax=Spodoptera exigua TaxID=7107 RepID=A0A835L143_SPOEX|nr:hypothetical protein HW555_010886 [Spodoptera exigua]
MEIRKGRQFITNGVAVWGYQLEVMGFLKTFKLQPETTIMEAETTPMKPLQKPLRYSFLFSGSISDNVFDICTTQANSVLKASSCYF